MILCKTRKICILGPTKTGSSTLSYIFKDVPLDFKSDLSSQHYTYKDYVEKNIVSDEELKTYTFYSFYRNPIERFFSAARGVRREGYVMSLQRLMDISYIDPVRQLEFIGEPSYKTLTSECQSRLEKIPERNMFHPYASIFFKQKHWLDIPAKIVLLDFNDFTNQAKMLLSLFDVTDVEIPIRNPSIKAPEYDAIHQTDKMKQFIKSKYKEDYDFFAEKGITFPE